ncbi:60S ribosomal protein L21-2, partial [Camellia lanceoleosa]
VVGIGAVRKGDEREAMFEGMLLVAFNWRCERKREEEEKAISSMLSCVDNKIIRKRIHVRIEHVQPSRCTEDFKLRKNKNDQLKAEAKARGEVFGTKRQLEGPKPGFMVAGATLETVTPTPCQ